MLQYINTQKRVYRKKREEKNGTFYDLAAFSSNRKTVRFQAKVVNINKAHNAD
jgi:hypothetical protein